MNMGKCSVCGRDREGTRPDRDGSMYCLMCARLSIADRAWIQSVAQDSARMEYLQSQVYQACLDKRVRMLNVHFHTPLTLRTHCDKEMERQ